MFHLLNLFGIKKWKLFDVKKKFWFSIFDSGIPPLNMRESDVWRFMSKIEVWMKYWVLDGGVEGSITNDG